MVVDGQMHQPAVLLPGVPQKAHVGHVHRDHVLGGKFPQLQPPERYRYFFRHRVGAVKAHPLAQGGKAPAAGRRPSQRVPRRGRRGSVPEYPPSPAAAGRPRRSSTSQPSPSPSSCPFSWGTRSWSIREDVGPVLDGVRGLEEQLRHMAQREPVPQLVADVPGGGLQPRHRGLGPLQAPPWCSHIRCSRTGRW